MTRTPQKGKLTFLRLWQAIAWLMVAVVVMLSLMPQPPQLDAIPGAKLQHLLAYAGLMFWFRQVFTFSISWAIFLVVLGVILEFIQDWTGYRYFEYGDMLANTLGVVCGFLLASTPLGSLVGWLDRTLAGWTGRY